jgi:hypothetical protein
MMQACCESSEQLGRAAGRGVLGVFKCVGSWADSYQWAVDSIHQEMQVLDVDCFVSTRMPVCATLQVVWHSEVLEAYGNEEDCLGKSA